MKRILTIISIIPALLAPSTILADTSNSEDRLSDAVRYFHEANYNGAIEELKAVYKDSRAGSTAALDASYLLGMSYRAVKDWKEAAVWLEKASRHRHLADYSLYYLGEAYINGGNYQSALDPLLTLLSRFPESRWKEEAGFKASEALFQLGRHGESRPSFERFIKENPKSPLMAQARMRIAETTEMLGNPREAYNFYKAIWIDHPASPEAGTAFEKAMQISSKETIPAISVDERYRRGCNLLSGNNLKEGVKELVPLLKEVGDSGEERPGWFAEALLNLGNAYYQVRDDENVLAALNKLSEAVPSPEIMEEALFLAGKALQRSGKRTEAAATFDRLTKEYPKGDFAPKGIYRLADMAEGDGDLTKARDLYKRLYTEFPNDTLADDAFWKKGWLTYLEKDYRGAAVSFRLLLASYPSSEFTDTVTYWLGRSAEKTGETGEAIDTYLSIVNNFPLSYYSVLSKARLSATTAERPLPLQVKTVSYSPLDRRQIPDKYVTSHIDKGKTLLHLGFNRDASIEFAMAESRCTDKKTLLDIADLQTRAGDYYRAQRIAINNFQEHLKDDTGRHYEKLWSLAFPIGFSEHVRLNAETKSLNPYLIHAVIREESSYRPDAVSRAGAIGLMQLMPVTGSNLSMEAGFRDYSTQLLYRPDVNITLGAVYLKKLLKNCKDSLPLALASYNAGPDALSAWISRYATEDMDEFIERIPYSETRNYVKRILRSYSIYERLYGKGVDAE